MSCELLLNYVLLTPYWIVVVSQIVTQIAVFIWNLFGLLKNKICPSKTAKIIAKESTPEFLARNLFTISPTFALFQILVQLSHFVYIVVKVALIPNVSSWYRYEALYSTYLNSGAPSIAANFVPKLLKSSGNSTIPKVMRFLAIFLYLSVIPGFLTNIGPMAVVYCWFSLFMFLFVIGKQHIPRFITQNKSIKELISEWWTRIESEDSEIACRDIQIKSEGEDLKKDGEDTEMKSSDIQKKSEATDIERNSTDIQQSNGIKESGVENVKKKSSKVDEEKNEIEVSRFKDNWSKLIIYYIVLTICNIITVIFCQAFWSYGVLWYTYNYTYIGVLQTDYNMRSTTCYFNSLIGDKDEVLNGASTLYSFITYFL